MFKIGDKVKTVEGTAKGVVTSVQSNGIVDVDFDGLVCPMHPNELAIINHAVQVPYNSQPVIPYAGNKSHTAHSLSLALGERHMSAWISEKWARWDDEARYLAGVIIGSHDATIEG